MINVFSHVLGFDLDTIRHTVVNGTRWYQASKILHPLGLRNINSAVTKKLPAEHREKIRTEFIDRNGRRHAVRPVFVTETGIWLIIMKNQTPALMRIRSEIAALLPRVARLN